jgi:RimJ/RimL family protein N-acetyltransferase
MDFELRTDRLLLRRWQAGDREPFARLNADGEVMRFFPAPLSGTESDALADRADAMFDQYGYGLWALQRRDTGEFIGFTGLAPMPDGVPGAGEVEVGWRLARSAWGHGFATEAAVEAVRFGFDLLCLTEVNSITAVINMPSRRVMERLGLHPAGEFEHPRVPKGSVLRPHVRYRLAAHDAARPAR